MTTLLAMGQFEAMIRHDESLRNSTLFNVYNHPAKDDDALAVVYIESDEDGGVMFAVTRLNVVPTKADFVIMNEVVCELSDKHGKSFDDGLLAITARSVRFNNDFSELIKQNPLAALQLVLNDREGYDLEYQSYSHPVAIKMAEGLSLHQVADWIRINQTQTRTYIHFTLDGHQFVVLGRQFREESFLMLTSYNKYTKIAYFDGMVSGRPIHQRVALQPDGFVGDKTFIEKCQKTIIEKGDAGNKLWRIRHLGVHVASDGNVFIRGPHLAGRNSDVIPNANEHDFTDNRIIIL